ncbi:DUF1080 domain-containing protein [Lewinella sp. IMCC34191]|uniref:3-keto-disaccharide hydrolase n=1 Tax=Lewinella sp. IMCC34191 TaxID=2259172 RepID=UPI000E24A6F8|nr:DUF1080 domain-containing protein [Lewinella sp. IMCC34191]
MKSIIPLSLLIILLAACGSTQPNPEDTAAAEGQWESIFNGKDLTGWEAKVAGYPAGDNPRNTFRVEDSMLRISYADYDSFDNLYGHLYFTEPLSYYKVRFDYRFVGDQVPGGTPGNVRNSGIMLHSQSAESNEEGQYFPVSIELQLLGGLGRGPRPTGNVCTPGTAVVMGDTVNYRHCINSSSDTYEGDDWITAEAVVLGGEAMHFLIEGDTVLSFQKPQIGGGFIGSNDSPDRWASFGIDEDREEWLGRDGEILTEGFIALQAESHPIDFRNIELLRLKE